MNKEKAVAFIVARLSSSRFPRKHFRKIGHLSLIDWIIYHLKQSKQIDQIVLATVAEECNKPFIKWCRERDVSCFWYRGDINHVTTRLVKAAQEYNADICILVSGDCPLPHAESIDLMIKELRRHPDKDYISIAQKDKYYPAIQGIQVAWRRTWELADKLSNTPELKEHHFPILSERRDLFKAYELVLSQKLYTPFSHRLSIDTWADLEFFNKIYLEIKKKNKIFSLPNVVDILIKQPSILNINKHVHQRQLYEEIKNILIVADAGSKVGYGHLMRSIELAIKITECLGWPVTFLVQDKKAKEIIDKYAIKNIYKKYIIDYFINNISLIELNKFDIILFDLFHKRDIPINWLDNFIKLNKIIIILDNLSAWCLKAHKIIIPGVTINKQLINNKFTNIVWGKKYIIIRDDIYKQKEKSNYKELDFLIYLHNDDLRKKIKNFISEKFNIKIITQFTTEFPTLLAKSKMFLGSFGYTFYEALFLKCYPICIPETKKHEEEALLFYKNLGLPPKIINKIEEIKNFKEALSFPEEVTIKNGVKNIIKEIRKFK